MAELSELHALLADSSLKAYYRLESGALTTDSSGQGKTLTNNNSVTNATGKYGDGADFGTANTNKSLSIADALSYTGGAYSISCWAKITTEITVNGTVYLIVNVAEAGTDTVLQIYYQRVAGVNKVTFSKFKNTVGGNVIDINGSLGTSSFHHICLVYDGSLIRGYVDGVDSGTTATSGVGTNGLSNNMAIGVNATSNIQYANAVIDDVAFFNKALSLSEVNLLYNNLAATQNYLTNYRGRKRTPGTVSV